VIDSTHIVGIILGAVIAVGIYSFRKKKGTADIQDIINTFTPLLEQPTSKNGSKFLKGKYKKHEIVFSLLTMRNTRHLEISCAVSVPESKKVPWYKFIAEYPEIIKGYWLSGTEVRFGIRQDGYKKPFEFSESPKQILDGLIEACNKVESGNF